MIPLRKALDPPLISKCLAQDIVGEAAVIIKLAFK